jgi:hypothetical protein
MKAIDISDSRGQVMMVLVMIMAIVTIVFTHVSFINTAALSRSNDVVDGGLLRAKTEGYLESAALRFIRDGSYTGESLNDGELSCTIIVTDMGSGTYDIESACQENGRTRTLGMTVSELGGAFQFSRIVDR